MRVVITGGGTGGHLFPGMAVAEELISRDLGIEVIFIGNEKGIESKVVPKANYQIRFIRVEGMIGRSTVKKLKAAALLLIAFRDSMRLLKELDPDIVIGTGGYVSVCPVAAAAMMKKPTLIMEQNLVPGVASKLLGRFADAVALTYYESLSFFPRQKSHLTGNPVRLGIAGADRLKSVKLFSLDPSRFTVFVFGGSQGSRAINNTMINALNYLLDLKGKIQIIHQTGDKDYDGVRDAYRKMGFKGAVAPFIYRMAEAYAVADLVVSRAGATTLAEITSLGKPSILIPFPHAAHSHQEFNAKKLAEMGAAKMMLEDDLNGEVLAAAVREIYMSDDLRSNMRKQSRVMGRPDAARKVADLALSIINKSSGYKKTVDGKMESNGV